MGKQAVKEMPALKLVTPAQTLVSLTPGDVTGGTAIDNLGVIPLGVYKGEAAFWDLDKLVNQPLASIEKQHVLGVLDGREEDYDLQTLAIVLAEAIGTAHMAQLTVPTDEVWFVNAVETVVPASGGANIITANWYCSMWTDRLGALGYGQPFHGAALNFGAGGGTQWDEFGVIPLLWAATNKPETLRLPSGTVLTVIFTNTGVVAAAAANCLFRAYGYVGRKLVA